MSLPRRKRWPDDYQSDGDTDDKGVRCPACHCRDTRVYYTRPTYGKRTLRRRICRNCERKFSTYEANL